MQVGDPPDVSSLPSNFFMKNLLATLSLANEQSATNLICENCDSADSASTRCEQCSRYLCQFCTDAHKRFRDTKDHIPKSISELKESPPSMIAETVRCTKHKDEIVKLYCTTCQATICRDCTIVDHRQHNFSFVEDVAKEKKDELLHLLEEVKERKTQVSEVLEKVSEREKSLDARNESTVTEITEYFESLAKVLDVRKNELVEKATALKDAKQKQLHAQREGLGTTLASCESNIEFTEQAFKNGNDVQLLNMKKYISQSLETLKNTKSQTDPCVDEHIEFVAELSEYVIGEKLVGSFTVADTKGYPENYRASFNGYENWLKIGTESEITITYAYGLSGSERRNDNIKPVFTGVAVKNVSVLENDDGSHNVSFVALEVGVLKFEVLINGRPVPQCTLSKGVKWTLVKWDWGTSSGDCILESGVHTWKINGDHKNCNCWGERADFKVGVIDHDGGTQYCLSGFTKSQWHISLKLDMSTGKLDVTPSWGKGLPSSYSVDCARVCPFFTIDCETCDVRVVEMGPFSFEDM